MTDNELLLTRMADLAQRAQKTGAAHSKFLTPSEAADVYNAYKNRKDVDLLLDGGFENAERAVAVFVQPDWGLYEREDVLAALRLSYREQDSLRHQDVLGAVLGLGLSRDVLGDIFVEPGRAFTVCLAQMADYIADSLTKAGRVGLAAERVALDALPDPAKALSEKHETVASLRLDAVVAAAFKLSRADAAEAIRAGRVQLAHRECLDIAKLAEPGNIISFKGKGRVKLLELGELSKKGRRHIVLGYYT